MSTTVTIDVIGGRSAVKRAMLATQGKRMKTPDLSNRTMFKLLIGMHSVCDEMRFLIELDGVSERVHTHIVRHEEIGKYVSTARPDTSDMSKQGSRLILLNIPLLRLIQIMRQRLCTAAFVDTRMIFEEIRKQICELDPLISRFLVPPCAAVGYCTELNTKCNRYQHLDIVSNYNWFNDCSRSIKTFNDESDPLERSY